MSIIVMMCSAAYAQQNTHLMKNIADNWEATDALGRELPCYDEVSPRRGDRLVCFIICGMEHKVYDISKILMQKPENRKCGLESSYHFWSESILTSHTDKKWMLLFIDADLNKIQTGKGMIMLLIWMSYRYYYNFEKMD